MAYADFTDEQKTDIALYDTYLRGVFSSLANIAKTADVDQWYAFATVNVDPLIAGLDDADAIPNSTGLGGAKDMTVSEFKTLQVIARQLTTLNTANRDLLVKAVGVNA